MSKVLLILVESRTHLFMSELQLLNVRRCIGLQPGLEAVTDGEDILPILVFLEQNEEDYKRVSQR